MKRTIIISLIAAVFLISCFDEKDDKKEISPKNISIKDIKANRTDKSDAGENIVYIGQNFDFTITLTAAVETGNVPLQVYFIKADRFADLKAIVSNLSKSEPENDETRQLEDKETTIGKKDYTDPDKIRDDPDLKNMIAADPILIPSLKKGTHEYDLSIFVPQRNDIETSSHWKMLAIIDAENTIESLGDTQGDIGVLDEEGVSDGSLDLVFLPVSVSIEKMLIPDIAVEWVVDRTSGIPLFTDVIVFPAAAKAPVDDNGDPIFTEAVVDDDNVYIEGNIRVFALNQTILNVPLSFQLYSSSGDFITALEVWDSEIDGYSDSYIIAELPRDVKNNIIPFSLVIPNSDIRDTISSYGSSFIIKATVAAPAGIQEFDAALADAEKNNSVKFDITIVEDSLSTKNYYLDSRSDSETVLRSESRNVGLLKSKEYNTKLGNNNFGVEILNEGKLEVNSTVGAMVTLTQDRNINIMGNALNVNNVEFVAQFAPQSPTDTHAHMKFSVLGVNLYYWSRAVEFSKEKKWETQKEKAYPPTVVMVGPVPINLQAGIQGTVGFKISAYLDSEQPEGADEPGSIFNVEGANELNDAYQNLKEENEARIERWKEAKKKETASKGTDTETAKDARRKANADDRDSGDAEERPGVEYPDSTDPGSGALVAEAGPYISAGAFAQASLGIPGFFEAGIKGNLNIISIELTVKGMVKFALEDYLPENWEARDVLVLGSGEDFEIVAISDVKKKLWTSQHDASLQSPDGYLILEDDEGNPVYADTWSYFAEGDPILVYEAVKGDETTPGSLLYNLKKFNGPMYNHYQSILKGTIKNTGENKMTFRKYQLGDVNALVFFPKVEFGVDLTLAGPSGSIGPFAKMYYPRICNAQTCFSFRFFGRRYRNCWTIYYPCGLGSVDWYYPLAEFCSWSKTYPLLAFAMPYKDEWKIRIPMDENARFIVNNYALRVSSPATVEPERRLALFGVDLSKVGTGESLVDVNLPADISDYSY